jgi:CBS domain-containing protein
MAVKTRNFNTINADTLVIDALNLISTLNLSYLIVMDNEEYKGIFSERDYSRNLILKNKASATTKVGEVMTTDLPMVRLNDTAETCIQLASLHNTSYLLVYDEDGKFVGVVTVQDLLSHVLTELQELNSSPVPKLAQDIY